MGRRKMRVTIGTHNLHDDEGRPTGFADILFFTEAIPEHVRKALEDNYVIKVCRWQKDLVIAWNKQLPIEFLDDSYFLAHPGLAKVTPHRGTYVVKVMLNGVKTKLIVEHRINAAFPPFRRGEKFFRPKMWKLHRWVTMKIVRHSTKRGWQVIAAGDLNTIPSVLGYRAELYEVGMRFGHGYDRLASSHPVVGSEQLSRADSDHHRIKAAVWC